MVDSIIYESLTLFMELWKLINVSMVFYFLGKGLRYKSDMGGQTTAFSLKNYFILFPYLIHSHVGMRWCVILNFFELSKICSYNIVVPMLSFFSAHVTHF